MKINPSFLFNSFLAPVNIKTNNNNVAKNIRAISNNTNDGTKTGRTKGIIPITNKILKTLLPIIFPTAKSVSFFLTAETQTASSGSEVPKAIIVAEIKNSPTPS